MSAIFLIFRGAFKWDTRECTAVQRAKLRVNIKSLAAEARFIRREAGKLPPEDRWWLDSHRQYTVRNESRVTQWAYAYARNIPLKTIEPNSRPLDRYHLEDFRKRTMRKLSRLGIPVAEETFDTWLGA